MRLLVRSASASAVAKSASACCRSLAATTPWSNRSFWRCRVLRDSCSAACAFRYSLWAVPKSGDVITASVWPAATRSPGCTRISVTRPAKGVKMRVVLSSSQVSRPGSCKPRSAPLLTAATWMPVTGVVAGKVTLVLVILGPSSIGVCADTSWQPEHSPLSASRLTDAARVSSSWLRSKLGSCLVMVSLFQL